MMDVTLELVEKLLHELNEPFSHEPIRAFDPQGHDHRSYRLGNDFVLRLPSADRYGAQIEKEAQVLNGLSKHLPLTIPHVIRVFPATSLFNRPWSLLTYISGEPIDKSSILDMPLFISKLSNFLKALHQIIPNETAPLSGAHNFYRGSHVSVYDQETRAALKHFKDDNRYTACLNLWNQACLHPYTGPNRWVHGDFEHTNLIMHEGQLKAVIDFGSCAIGDPACDYVMAWTFFSRTERSHFLNALSLSEDMIHRAKAWALWKALITLVNPDARNLHPQAKQTINAVLDLDE